MTGVPVGDASSTVIGSDAARIDTPPSAASYIASGMVTVKGNAANTGAVVRAMQALSGGPTIEAGYSAANDSTGGYSMLLPADAPVKLAYAVGATTFAFSSAGQVPGAYTLEASAPTCAVMSTEITLNANVTKDFAFMP